MLSDGVQRAMIENDWREADRHLVTVLLDDPHDADCGCHRCTTVAGLSDRLNDDAEALADAEALQAPTANLSD